MLPFSCPQVYENACILTAMSSKVLLKGIMNSPQIPSWLRLAPIYCVSLKVMYLCPYHKPKRTVNLGMPSRTCDVKDPPLVSLELCLLHFLV